MDYFPINLHESEADLMVIQPGYPWIKPVFQELCLKVIQERPNCILMFKPKNIDPDIIAMQLYLALHIS
ncbi:MAG: hypothetical protein DDT27_01037 [Dehalococcoidia bacterium]|nr:hypothetical protein [Chloroflexota bacterium]